MPANSLTSHSYSHPPPNRTLSFGLEALDDPGAGGVGGGEVALQLVVAEVVEEAAEFGAGRDAEGEEVVAGEQGRAQGGLLRKVGSLGLHEVVMLQ